ncbi:Lrp/AsnC family transcriptional regulator [Azonexus sp.]|uniref:siroheme decarboxylase subunit beta n=1 Tax=Azonexus sp. TaxID=1872668 RepID=UPI0035B1C421
MNAPTAPDAFERRLVRVTQEGLPLVPRPYASIAAVLGVSEAQVIERLQAMLERGAIRRIGAVPNHYAIGYTANGMSVWDIDDAAVDRVGELLGRQAAVSHCYRRPRRLPDWPYNLFAMLHGRQRTEVDAQLAALAALVERECGAVVRARDILFSSRILKKTGLRLGAGPRET